MDMKQTTIFIVEDQEILLTALKLMLDHYADLDVIGEATLLEGTLGKILTMRPDVVVMDITLPDGNSFELTKWVKEVFPLCRILMFSASFKNDDVEAAISAGADGYCLKGARSAQIAEAIRAVASGSRWFDSRLELFKSFKKSTSSEFSVVPLSLR